MQTEAAVLWLEVHDMHCLSTKRFFYS